MWGVISTTFLVLYCLMCIYIGHRGWTIHGKSSSTIYKVLYWIVFALLILTFPASEIFEDAMPENLGLMLTIWGGYSMIAVLYIFLMVLLIDLIRIIDKKIGFIPISIRDHEKTPLFLSYAVIALSITVLFYGTFNARNPMVTEYEITIPKKAGSLKQLNIVMVSDIHYGAIVNAERLDSMVETINKLQPDVILFAGDIVEGTADDVESRKLSSILGGLQSKYGKFAVPGNHDRGLRDDNSVLSLYFKKAGIHVLKDNYIKIEDSFYIIGRDDPGRRYGRGRKEIEELMEGVDKSFPLILLDHQPIDIENVQDSGIDLQVSGHTHSGQVFPANLITGQIYEMDWGLLKKRNYHLIVSCGYGTWGPPLRIGTRSEVVSIKVKFNE